MLLTIELIGLLGLAIACMFVRCKPWWWTMLYALLLILMTTFHSANWEVLAIAWAIYLMAVIFVHCHYLRRQWITRPVVKLFRQVLPPMSETERAALEAGNVWWEGQLFQGKPDWEKLHSYPAPQLTPREQAFLDNQVEKACEMLNDWEIVRHGDLPEAVWDYFKKEKFFSLLIPEAYGGLNFSAYMQSCVVCKLATRSVSAGVTVMVPNSLGPAELLIHYGTEAQKKEYLPRLASGELLPCFALTSLQGGSDAGAMQDKGIVCYGEYQGKEVLGIRLTFDKRYITLAPRATLVGLAFKLYDPDRLLGKKENIGITCALLPSTHPGVEIGRRHSPMDLAFLNGPVRGKDVFIPIDWVIGGEAQVGNGWRMLMECLSAGRGISLPALSTAAAKLGYAMTGAYAKLREQFNLSIGKFEGVQEKLAVLGGFAYMLEATRVMTAGAVDLVGKPALASAIAKYHMTEMLRRCTDVMMDIHAGRAIQNGPMNYLANMYKSIPVAITVEGANILTRSLIIFGQGAIRCHPYVFAEMQALLDKDTERGLKTFDGLLVSHMGYGLSNFIRAICYGWTNARGVISPRSGPTAYYYRQLTRMSTALSLISGLSMMLLGGDLKRRESISARLGDVLSYLYMSSAVLKYFEDYGSQSEELLYVHWVLRYCLYQMQEALYGVFHNFPNKTRGYLFRWIIFPLGRCYEQPSDHLMQAVAEHMMTNSELRERLYSQIFYSTNPKTPTGCIESAFLAMLEVEPLLKKLHQAMRKKQISKIAELSVRLDQAVQAGVLTRQEADAVKAFEKQRVDALKVDDFAP